MVKQTSWVLVLVAGVAMTQGCQRGAAPTSSPTGAPTSPAPTATATATAAAGSPAHGGDQAHIAAPNTPKEVDVANARTHANAQLFTWETWSAETFAKAKRTGKPILLHGAAAWCHWCHVMEETTYRNPAVGALIRDRFVAIRVDIDARPDIEERYAAWGWPATILLTSSADELGKFRGYIKAKKLLPALKAALKTSAEGGQRRPSRAPKPPVATLQQACDLAGKQLDGYYSSERGGWGSTKMTPLGQSALFELERRPPLLGSNHSTAHRGLIALGNFRRLIDPEWGGIYQYSTHGRWDHPHFEKLTRYQTDNLEAFSRAYGVTGDPRWLKAAKNIDRYLLAFLSDGKDGYYVSQDADLGGAEHDARFVDGHVYFAKSDIDRRKLGIPRVDKAVYAEENGRVLVALAEYHRATKDVTVLDRAKRTANRILATHVNTGSVAHDPTVSTKVVHLADGAALALGLLALNRVAPNDKWVRAASEIVAGLSPLYDRKSQLYYDHSEDPAAAGVFRKRLASHRGNVLMARAMLELSRADANSLSLPGGKPEKAAANTLRALAPMLDEEGRMVGEFLRAGLALGCQLKAP